MKRMLAITLALCLIVVASPITAFAAGKIETTKETCISIENWGEYGYAYARVENTGDKPAAYSSGLFELYDANGDTLGSTTYLNVYGNVLQPGEYAYAETYVSIDESHTSADVDDYILDFTAKNGSNNQTLRFPCEAEWVPDLENEGYGRDDYMTATFTNTTDDFLYNVSFAFALLDDENNVLYVDDHSLHDYIGIAAGSTVVVRLTVSYALLEYYANKGITPTHVDAYAYVDIE